MKGKAKSRLHVLLFGAAIFILTCIGYAETLTYAFSPIILAFIFVAAFFLLLGFVHDFLMAKFNWSVKKLLLLTVGVMLAAATVTQTVWAIVTPSWSFSVATDKPTYSLGESVKITATLKNTGFLSHSFKSKVSDPVLLLVSQVWHHTDEISVWWPPSWNEEVTEFSLSPGQALQRSFTWDQTNIANPQIWNQTHMPGTYQILAFIPDPNAESISPDHASSLFYSATYINVTQS